MSGRAPQRRPRDARTIPAYVDDDGWMRLARYSLLGRVRDVSDTIDLLDERERIWPWLVRNGFRYYVPEDAPIYLSQDGRTVYLERFMIRTPSPWNRSQTGARPTRDRYVLTPEGTDARRRFVGYPITRPLEDYAPTLAARLQIKGRR